MEDWFYDNLNELKKRIIIIIAAVSVVSIFAFSFGVQVQEFAGIPVPYPYMSIDKSVSALFFQKLKADLLPPNVELIVTRPADAVLLQIGVSFFLGFMIALPLVVHQIVRFILPALKRREKKLVGRIILWWLPLFLAGAVFSYVVVVPMMLNFLYGYVFALGAHPFLNVDDFASFTMQFVIAFGLIFTLPTIMGVLTAIGVEPGFWKRNWKYALGAMVLFGAVITPDGSMVTLALVAAPMIVLYSIGYVASRFIHKRRQEADPSAGAGKSLIRAKSN